MFTSTPFTNNQNMVKSHSFIKYIAKAKHFYCQDMLLFVEERTGDTYATYLPLCGLAKCYSIAGHGPVLICKLTDIVSNKVRIEIDGV